MRAFLIIAGALTVPMVVLAAAAGEERPALSGALIAGGVLLLATWGWGYPSAFPIREWAALGLVAAGVAVMGQPVIAICLLLAVLVLNVAGTRYRLRRLHRVEFETVADDSVMPEARAVVAEFETRGYGRVGGFRLRLPLGVKVITSSVLASDDPDRFAVATDRVWQVVSRYGTRWLVTTNSGLATLPGVILRQLVAGARPDDLDEVHQRTLDLLAARGVMPDRFASDAGVLEAALALEQDAIRFTSTASLGAFLRIETRGRNDDPALGSDEASRRRIDAWLAASAH